MISAVLPSILLLLGLLLQGCASEDACGRRFFEDKLYDPHQGYIVGGSRAVQGSLPWQVSIQRGLGAWGVHCGGTIINRRWILTAGHCFGSSSGPSDFTVVAGEYRLFYTDKGQDGASVEQTIKIERLFVHPSYDKVWQKNDIALIKLKSDIKFNEYVQPACLPKLATEVSDYAAGKEVIVSGWGSTNNDNAFPDYLQVAQVPIIADSYCKRRDVYGNGISYSMVCAGKLGRVDSCSGDSGGPMVRKIDGKFTVLGIVSWGSASGCAHKTKPGVYTRVARFEKWIQDKLSRW